MLSVAENAIILAMPNLFQELRRSIARIVIATLRDPPGNLMEKAMPGLIDFGYFPEEWKRMIEVILKENEHG